MKKDLTDEVCIDDFIRRAIIRRDRYANGLWHDFVYFEFNNYEVSPENTYYSNYWTMTPAQLLRERKLGRVKFKVSDERFKDDRK